MNNKYVLSINDSMQLKGITLMLLLCHHLFYQQTGLYIDVTILNHGLVHEFALVCKVCVALFVFLSGYGLGVQHITGNIDIKRFYKRRFTKLMPSYWLMWILFVPIGIIFFGRTLDVVYGDYVVPKLIINIMGFQDYAGFYGFNPTWWFMSCIIGLYLMFPILIKQIDNHLKAMLVVSFILLLKPIPHFSCLTNYLFPFIAGTAFARKQFAPPHLLNNITILIVLIILTMLYRQLGCGLKGLRLDPILAIEIVLLFKAVNVKSTKVQRALFFIGKHSMNIFLFHTFIFAYYMKGIIYYTGNPLVIFTELLAICLVISILIEKLKEFIPIFKTTKTLQ